MEFAAAAGLVVMNDPQSKPTYETAYAASWINLTLATPSVLMAGYTWIIAVDDPSKDLPEHAEARQMAARPYDFNELDVPFTEAEHADYLKEKTELLVAKIGVLSGMQAGLLRPEQMVTLYRNVILPANMYASPVWWDAICPDCRPKSRVTSLQRAVLLNLLGAFKTTRTTALQVLMRAPPVTLKSERANAESELLIARKPIRFGQLSVRQDRVLPTLDVWQEHPAARCAFRFLRLTRDEARRIARLPGLHIYTDGSYTDRLAGAAFIVLGPSERIGAVGRYQVENATSAYCTEVIALIEALRYVKNKCSATTVTIYTDSLSLLQAISEYKTTDPRVRDVKALLNDISATTEITLYHVPGHSGLFGNELADFLAARAARLGDARQACSLRERSAVF
ncbi:hypothetical protein MRX96_005055 [Rhipicephalus microplus]